MEQCGPEASTAAPGSISENKTAAEPLSHEKVTAREAQKDGTTNCGHFRGQESSELSRNVAKAGP